MADGLRSGINATYDPAYRVSIADFFSKHNSKSKCKPNYDSHHATAYITHAHNSPSYNRSAHYNSPYHDYTSGDYATSDESVIVVAERLEHWDSRDADTNGVPGERMD